MNGVLNLNKPAGISSAAAVAKVKRLLPRGTKIGHAGTLDPFATGVLLLLVYSLGLGIPFLLLGMGLDRLSRLLKWLKPHTGKIEIGTGIIMITMGVMIYFNLLLYLNRFFNVGITV